MKFKISKKKTFSVCFFIYLNHVINIKWNTTGKIDHKIDDNSEAEGGTILRYDTVINIVVMFLRSLNMLISPDCYEV